MDIHHRIALMDINFLHLINKRGIYMSNKKRIFLIIICTIVIAVIFGSAFVIHNKKDRTQQIAEDFLSDFFKWDSDRGEALIEGGEEEFNKRWGKYISSSFISNLLENRSPIKYDLLYGTNRDVDVENIKYEFDDTQTCNFSLEIVYTDENQDSKMMNIRGQLIFQDNSFRRDPT